MAFIKVKAKSVNKDVSRHKIYTKKTKNKKQKKNKKKTLAFVNPF